MTSEHTWFGGGLFLSRAMGLRIESGSGMNQGALHSISRVETGLLKSMYLAVKR